MRATLVTVDNVSNPDGSPSSDWIAHVRLSAQDSRSFIVWADTQQRAESSARYLLAQRRDALAWL